MIMKKRFTVIAILLITLMLAVSVSCRRHGDDGPSDVDIPTPVATEPLVPLSAEEIDRFIGDWYGVYSVTEARGVFAPNSGVVNDCAMRVAFDGLGRGSVYLQVNGMGRDEVSGKTDVFAMCSALIRPDRIDISGRVNTQDVNWSFDYDEGKLKLVEVYGGVDDHMRIEIELARPDELLESGIAVDAKDYLARHGFAEVIDALGGSTKALPEISVPAGADPHVFFTGGSETVDVTPVPSDSSYLVSADGHITVSVPEGYVVVKNSVMDFVLAAPDQNVMSVDFTVSSWDKDGLSFLLGNTPDVKELYHYTIDGFDFYGTFIENPVSDAGSTMCFKMCGTDGDGNLIIINITLAMDQFTAYSYVNVDNSAFTELILGAKFMMK